MPIVVTVAVVVVVSSGVVVKDNLHYGFKEGRQVRKALVVCGLFVILFDVRLWMSTSSFFL